MDIVLLWKNFKHQRLFFLLNAIIFPSSYSGEGAILLLIFIEMVIMIVVDILSSDFVSSSRRFSLRRLSRTVDSNTYVFFHN